MKKYLIEDEEGYDYIIQAESEDKAIDSFYQQYPNATWIAGIMEVN